MPRSYVHEARRRVGPKRARIRPIIERLAAEHADAAIALRFTNPLELLVSVMLSAQTTDVNVNRVTENLFRKYRRPEDYLGVPQAELEHAQGIVVDTHVRRLSQRLGLTREEDTVKIERDLMKIVPREDWGRFPHLLIWHGRRVCIARRPECERCVVNDLCPASRV